MNLTRHLAETYLRLGFSSLPIVVNQATRLSLADGIAAMLAATRAEPATEPFATIARQYCDQSGSGSSAGGVTLLAGGRSTPSGAALANGALSHAIDYEDTFDPAGLHPKAEAIPVLLALADAEAKSLGDLLAALAVGCDLTCRLGLSLTADPASRGWYHPPMLGAAGAALAGAHLLGLDLEETVAALSLTQTRFALTDALKRSPASDLRAIRDGLAAQAALDAVLLARAGVIGTDDPLGEPGGLVHLITGDAPNELAFEGIGRRFSGALVTLKTWPCCRGTHGAIQLALDMRGRGVKPDDIAGMRFTVMPPDDMLFTPLADRQAPSTAIGAKFSIPYCFAYTLINGAPGLAAFDRPARQDDAVLDLASRITMASVSPTGPARAEIHQANLPAELGGLTEELLPEPPSLIAEEARFADIEAKLHECAGVAGGGEDMAQCLMGLETADPDTPVAAWLDQLLAS
jgi:2-methylcitrate dehydratase PrpD